jgi:hypothetical protein
MFPTNTYLKCFIFDAKTSLLNNKALGSRPDRIPFYSVTMQIKEVVEGPFEIYCREIIGLAFIWA